MVWGLDYSSSSIADKHPTGYLASHIEVWVSGFKVIVNPYTVGLNLRLKTIQDVCQFIVL